MQKLCQQRHGFTEQSLDTLIKLCDCKFRLYLQSCNVHGSFAVLNKAKTVNTQQKIDWIEIIETWRL